MHFCCNCCITYMISCFLQNALLFYVLLYDKLAFQLCDMTSISIDTSRHFMLPVFIFYLKDNVLSKLLEFTSPRNIFGKERLFITVIHEKRKKIWQVSWGNSSLMRLQKEIKNSRKELYAIIFLEQLKKL